MQAAAWRRLDVQGSLRAVELKIGGSMARIQNPDSMS